MAVVIEAVLGTVMAMSRSDLLAGVEPMMRRGTSRWWAAVQVGVLRQ